MLRPFNSSLSKDGTVGVGTKPQWRYVAAHDDCRSEFAHGPPKGDFDQVKLEELGTAAVMYAKDHGSAFLVKLETA